MEFAPRPLTPLAMLLDQPLARAVDLQPGRVDHDVHRPAARLYLRQRRGERQARTASRERGMIGHADAQAEQHCDGAQQALGLPPRAAEREAQQVPRLDRHRRVVAWPPSLARPRRLPGRECLRCDPDSQAPALLQRAVIFGPVLDAVACPGDLVTAWFICLVGHQASGARGSGPLRPTVAPPKPRTAFLHQGLAHAHAVPETLVREACVLHRLPTTSPAYWQGWSRLRARTGVKFHALVAAVSRAMADTPRSSSLVENLNSRLRSYFTLRRHLGGLYLDLLRLFLNHRRVLRSRHAERQGKSPCELMTGQGHAHWLTLLGLGPLQPQRG